VESRRKCPLNHWYKEELVDRVRNEAVLSFGGSHSNAKKSSNASSVAGLWFNASSVAGLWLGDLVENVTPTNKEGISKFNANHNHVELESKRVSMITPAWISPVTVISISDTSYLSFKSRKEFSRFLLSVDLFERFKHQYLSWIPSPDPKEVEKIFSRQKSWETWKTNLLKCEVVAPRVDVCEKSWYLKPAQEKMGVFRKEDVYATNGSRVPVNERIEENPSLKSTLGTSTSISNSTSSSSNSVASRPGTCPEQVRVLSSQTQRHIRPYAGAKQTSLNMLREINMLSREHEQVQQALYNTEAWNEIQGQDSDPKVKQSTVDQEELRQLFDDEKRFVEEDATCGIRSNWSAAQMQWKIIDMGIERFCDRHMSVKKKQEEQDCFNLAIDENEEVMKECGKEIYHSVSVGGEEEEVENSKAKQSIVQSAAEVFETQVEPNQDPLSSTNDSNSAAVVFPVDQPPVSTKAGKDSSSPIDSVPSYSESTTRDEATGVENLSSSISCSGSSSSSTSQIHNSRPCSKSTATTAFPSSSANDSNAVSSANDINMVPTSPTDIELGTIAGSPTESDSLNESLVNLNPEMYASEKERIEEIHRRAEEARAYRKMKQIESAQKEKEKEEEELLNNLPSSSESQSSSQVLTGTSRSHHSTSQSRVGFLGEDSEAMMRQYSSILNHQSSSSMDDNASTTSSTKPEPKLEPTRSSFLDVNKIFSSNIGIGANSSTGTSSSAGGVSATASLAADLGLELDSHPNLPPPQIGKKEISAKRKARRASIMNSQSMKEALGLDGKVSFDRQLDIMLAEEEHKEAEYRQSISMGGISSMGGYTSSSLVSPAAETINTSSFMIPSSSSLKGGKNKSSKAANKRRKSTTTSVSFSTRRNSDIDLGAVS